MCCAGQVVRRLIETEPYRVFDPGAGGFFRRQTENLRAGRLAFVMQNQFGVCSLVLVCGPSDMQLKIQEFTILLRDVL